jgi:hypothetical protein
MIAVQAAWRSIVAALQRRLDALNLAMAVLSALAVALAAF